jgi:hypothetical protein
MKSAMLLSSTEKFRNRLRDKLGTEKLENAWFDGQTMSQQQLIDLVMKASVEDGG